MKPLLLLVFCLISLPVMFYLSEHRSMSSVVWLQGISVTLHQEDSRTPNKQTDKFIGGLLSPSFDEESCLSRYRSALLRKESPHLPSSYLIERLRKYEELHKKCGPNTPLYHKSIIQLNLGQSIELMDCNYLVWTPFNGLGNRMLTIASAFLYAVLTNRILLIHQTVDMVDLFCEPFPDSTWILPSDFPIKNLTKLYQGSETSYGNMLKNKQIKDDVNVPSNSLPAYVYLHLEHDYQHLDKLFFCEKNQVVLQKINWLLLQSDIYFLPGLFLVPQFEDELRWMFPAKETVFHHLGRYLFHPTNTVWGMITRYHTAYLAGSDERIGIQVRVFSRYPISAEDYLKQILMCSQQESLLPEININGTLNPTKSTKKSKAVLITSLYPEYSEKLKSMYYEHTTVTGETVSVNQPTHEVQQQTEKQFHNQKALAEMYLLSYCDVLITTGWSTFGYIGQGLAGLKPWILLTPRDQKPAVPPCTRAVSMEPCFQVPPTYDCRAKKNADLGALVRHVTHCEDVEQGIKLVD
ncbi:fucosyltransferase 2 [Rhynchospora pubera]|uniref:Fucosyltransferase n=1 Tax=Rhynchospora pubera TaxID=906938 RepID=A0AAV8H9T7_9POAL|nr:fucosyltransferase 2 [Rhynchospora pubera]